MCRGAVILEKQLLQERELISWKLDVGDSAASRCTEGQVLKVMLSITINC